MAVSRNSRLTDLQARVAAFAATRLVDAKPVWLGLSGGCDSVVLLHLLTRLLPVEQIRVVHVHHGLSPNADAWAQFCVAYCASLHVSLRVCPVTPMLDSGQGIEAAARLARYQAFDTVVENVLLLAHHRGDQAETVLFNFLRGSGLLGLAAMPEWRAFSHFQIGRPLLGSSRKEIEAYAHEQGLRWVDDESNLDQALARNYLRHAVLPELVSHFPGVEQVLARTAGHCAEAQSLLDEMAAEDWQALARGTLLPLPALRRLSQVRLKNLLRYRLRMLGWRMPVSARLDEFVRQLLQARPDRHPALSLPEGVMACAQGALHWRPLK